MRSTAGELGSKGYDQVRTDAGLTRSSLRVRQSVEYLTPGLDIAGSALLTNPHLVYEKFASGHATSMGWEERFATNTRA
jgi:hypothetical protein